MPDVTMPTPAFVDLCQVLYGDLVDVEALWGEVSKMSPDPSSVHVAGSNMVLRSTRRRRRGEPVGKADIPLGALVKGRLSTLGMMTQRADPILAGGAKALKTRGAQSADRAAQAATRAKVPPSPRQVAASGAPRADLPPRSVPGDPVAPPPPAAAPATPAPATAMPGADGAAARQGLNQALGTTTGKVVVGGAALGLYRSGRNRGRQQGLASADPYAYSKGWTNPEAPEPAGPSPTTRKVVAGLSATGAVAGATGLAVAGREVAQRSAGAGIRAGLKATPKLTRALIPLEVAGLGGELAATKILHGDSREQPTSKRVDDVQWGGTFSKFDDDKRLAFGWASVVKVNGEPVIDRQGDYIGIGDIEDAAYVYVEKSRVGGDMHRRVGGKDLAGGDRPHHVADLVESMVFTPEKIEKMGLPRDFPVGWWVGFKVHDDDAWSEVKKGNRTGFSIHGKGIRKDVDYDSIMAGV